MDSIFFSTLRMLLVFAAIIAGIIVLYRYSGKLKLGIGLKSPGKGSGLQKGDTIHLGYHKFVSVLEIQGRVLVVGVGDKEMSLLASWKKEEKEGGTL